MRPGPKARLQLLAAAALFSTGGAAIKACHATGWQVAGLRSLFAVFAFLLFVRSARQWPTRAEWLVGVTYAATLVLFVLANKATTAANTIFLQSTAPVYILLAAPFVLGEKIRRIDVAFLLAMAGGLVLFFVERSQASVTAPRPWLGNGLALGSGLAWAATVMGLRALARGRGGEHARDALGAVIAGNALTFLVTTPFLLPLDRPGITDWLLLAYLGVFQIALAYLFFTASLTVLPAFEVSVLLLIEPVLNPLWAWILHGERPGSWVLAGGAVLILATTARSLLDARSGEDSQAEELEVEGQVRRRG